MTATLSRGALGVSVAAGSSAGPVSVALSRDLFVSAPVVVVALADDPAGLQFAAAQAQRLGVPLLVDDAPAGVDPSSGLGSAGSQRPAPTPGSGGSSVPTVSPSRAFRPMVGDAVRKEVLRLRPRAVLTVGAAAGLSGLPGTVTSRPQALPRVAHARPADLTVLVHLVHLGPATGAGTGPATGPGRGADPGPTSDPDLTVGSSASTPIATPTTAATEVAAVAAVAAVAVVARAFAGAAGATVVAVQGADLRADPVAVRALHSGRPGRVLAAGDAFGPTALLTQRVAAAINSDELPGGGQVLFPGRRLVALYGTPGTPSLGALGAQDLPATITRARQTAATYDLLSAVPVVPALEIIATVASADPGRDGNYSNELDTAALSPWVTAAGAAGMYVVLDLQPGRTDFLTQAKLYQDLLALPYVGLGLDAEWRLRPTQKPLQQIGSVKIEEVNAVTGWLSQLTSTRQLPQKLVVLHQFRLDMIDGEARLDTGHDNLALLIHMDGQGSPGVKAQTWTAVTAAAPPGVTFGWKNFYTKDRPTLTPTQTMTHQPTPSMITYQ